MKSPFRYAGGKYYARAKILPLIQSHNSYVEPFVGGGSIFFAKQKAKSNWLNDLDSDLINCYTQIRDNPLKVIELLRGEVATKERHSEYRSMIVENEIQAAAKYFYLNRTSFSGIMHPHKGYFGYDVKYSKPPEKWADCIIETSSKLQKVRLTSLDFETVIDTAVDGSFMFIDPPYFDVSEKLYRHTFETDDHKRLSDCLKRNKSRLNLLVTYDNSDFIRSTFDFLNQHNESWYYSCRNFQFVEKSTYGKELFLSNFPVFKQASMSFL
jgi:DNA adenine methylase